MQIRNPYCPPFITDKPSKELRLVVIIPCYNEPDLISSLQSLYDCDQVEGDIEIIVVINNVINAPADIINNNKTSYQQAIEWSKVHSKGNKKFFIHYFDDLPKKHAGVGLARKIAMDEAASRFQSIDNVNGIIQCYDADCTCEPNLIQAVIDGFEYHKTASLGIHYEHPIEGSTYPDNIYAAIISYELHLRYYNNIQKYIGLPFAFQTIGSSMAVRVKDYILQGGMNKKKAGEDFYFLQKFITIDRHAEIGNTTVIPSPRMSDRVPFGTGKAVNDIITEKSSAYMSYNPQAFIDLKILLEDINILYQSNCIEKDTNHWPNSLKSYFIINENIAKHILEIRANTTSFSLFEKRFFKWMNAFRLMKYLHFCRDKNLIPDLNVKEGAFYFITQFLKLKTEKSEKEMLLILRKIDRKNSTSVY